MGAAEEYLRELVMAMKTFRDENVFCDTVLTADDKELFAHSVVLAAVSPFLCSTFKGLGGNVAKRMRYNVSLPGCNAAAVETVLQFVYTGQLTLPLTCQQQGEEFVKILHVCKSLGVDFLKLNGAKVTFDGVTEREMKSTEPLTPKNNDIGTTRAEEDLLNPDNNSDLVKETNDPPSNDDQSTGRQPPLLISTEQSSLRFLTPLLSVAVPLAVSTHPPSSSSSSFSASDNRMKIDIKNGSASIKKGTPDAAENGSAIKLENATTTTTQSAEITIEDRLQKIGENTKHLKKLQIRTSRKVVDTKPLLKLTEEVVNRTERRIRDLKDLKEEVNFVAPPPPPFGKSGRNESHQKVSFDAAAVEETSFEGQLDESDQKRKRRRKPFECHACGREFTMERCFLKHVRSHDADDERSHVCDKCGKAFASGASLKAHQTSSHVDGYPHVCEVCGKGYKFKRYMLIHAMKHAGTKPFLCDTCGRGFYIVTNLKRHVLMWHTGVRPYVCGACGKGFVTRPRLAQHAETHSSERLHCCETCDAAFTNAGNLSRHRLLHTGEKAYVCPICFRAFTQKVTMQGHMAVHMDERTAYVCQICGRSLSKLSNLRKHMQMHSADRPHACATCGKTFTMKEYLTRHAVVHSEKRHVCADCGKAYRSERFLALHRKTHLAIECGRCGKAFSGARAMNTHMRVHAEEDPTTASASNVCGDVFEETTLLMEHSKTHSAEFIPNAKSHLESLEHSFTWQRNCNF